MPQRRGAPARARVTGHFGELLQGRLGAGGPVALISLPCPLIAAEARFQPAAQAPLMVSGSGGGPIARAAARALLARLRLAGTGGRLRVWTNAPIGGGAGSSTLSALSTLRAVSEAYGAPLLDATAAGLCLEVEGAVDPLAIGDCGNVLWASREARALARLEPGPRLQVVGGFDGPGAPTCALGAEFADISDLVGPMRAARASGDAAAVAAIATESAKRNQRLLAKPRFDAMARAAPETGAAGLVAAHTGSALGFLLLPSADPGPALRCCRALGLASVLRFTA